MKRILGEHFKLHGQPKRSFETKEDALRFLRDQNSKGHAYPCSFCGKWHVASK